jgi:hypothetical protein
MIFLVLILIVFVVLTIYSWYSAYNVLKYLLANWKGLFSKEFLFFFAIAIPLFIIVVYLGMRQPAYFEQGIKQLHSTKYIKDKIGDFSSYSFSPDKLPKNPTKQATFQIEINQDSLKFYLTCSMKKVGDDWKLFEVKQDSIVKIHKQ